MPSPAGEAQIVRIYRDTVDELYGYVSYRCGGERQLAEDVTQETWLRAVREWRVKGIPDKPIAWLTTVARNLILNQRRRQVPESLDVASSAEVIAAVDRGEAGNSAEIASIVNRALRRLPVAESRLLEAFHFERQRVAQLAQEYGISERAIEGRLRRARERLRRELETTLPEAGGTP